MIEAVVAALAEEAGVGHAIGVLFGEMDRNMAMLGVARCAALGVQHHIVRCRA
ncbi:hypothetical protein [Pseudorhodoferax sp.]|uniref:hypothetical protein n=1 Tax=Pseudorhodoferax sp. TaxID=1993553 RepID=UPI0039E61777